MNNIKPSTNSEKKIFKAIQKKVDSAQDGIIGCQTMVDIAVALGADCFPVTLEIYNMPVIIGNDLLAWSPKAPISGFKNAMCGSFTYPRATTPCSILINNGQVVCDNSCHSHIKKPESVIYKTTDGKIGMKRVVYASELPGNIKWAVGGMGLINMYDPVAEGFTGTYSDVLRKTNHNVLGVKNDKIYGVYYKDITGQEINNHCKNIMKFEKAILLDGGSLAAIHGEEPFSKLNHNTKQGYALQFI